ncbi:LacI family DNA-binding transcriptional regulator [Fundicoccus culcitae]|uniref:LacI family transcriptional regulator n=1 Tax=Fundicoccus culcitae TaxID=2969821 RepID=A0ABY5P669_9LACT|nr:LacI family DNA-binding transcriptional regulator [Fundicoccus culcitae]UUX33918.1 LacI family transcriptional regulator [Fundicoccus culcitae]
MATLKDVAKRANISKMTVSRVINHPQLVTSELRELVYQAMQDLNYQPNSAARALVSNRTMVIKVLILEQMDITEPYYMNLLTGISKQLDKYNYALQLVTENTVDLGQSDGLIVTGMKEPDYEWLQKFEKPLVVFGENNHNVPYVDSNNRKGAITATKYAMSRGYDHVVFVGLNVPERFEKEREKGYLEAIQASKTNHQPHIIRISNSSSKAEAMVRDELELIPNTCFVCGSDRIAIGIQQGLTALDKAHPEDYGIIGFDGVFLDQIASPKLTTMKQHIVEMGGAVVNQLMTLIDTGKLDQQAVYFDAELVVRQSTK